jgi:glycosyl transferase family 25
MLKKVYFINLDDRVDRKIAFLEEMKQYGLSDPDQVVRFPAVKTTPGYIGCALSHVGVLKQCLERNEDLVAIFEDDFAWKMNPQAVNEILERFFSQVGDWDVLIMAAPNYDLQTSEYGITGIKKCHRAQTTTGYIVKRHYMEKLISIFEVSAQKLQAGEKYSTWAIDQAWKKLQETDAWFITVPGIGKQRAGFSDIENAMVNYSFI